MDAQTAALYGQASSQPGGFPGAQQKGGGNEDLALALAAMASSPSMQNAVLGGGLTDATGNALQNAMLGGWGGGQQSASPVSSVFGDINAGIGAVNTGVNLYKAITSLFGGGVDTGGITEAGNIITAGNLAADWGSTPIDYWDWAAGGF